MWAPRYVGDKKRDLSVHPRPRERKGEMIGEKGLSKFSLVVKNRELVKRTLTIPINYPSKKHVLSRDRVSFLVSIIFCDSL